MIFCHASMSAPWKLSNANTPPRRWVFRPQLGLLSRADSSKPLPLCAER